MKKVILDMYRLARMTLYCWPAETITITITIICGYFIWAFIRGLQ
jgi:hypothetical protein